MENFASGDGRRDAVVRHTRRHMREGQVAGDEETEGGENQVRNSLENCHQSRHTG